MSNHPWFERRLGHLIVTVWTDANDAAWVVVKATDESRPSRSTERMDKWRAYRLAWRYITYVQELVLRQAFRAVLHQTGGQPSHEQITMLAAVAREYAELD